MCVRACSCSSEKGWNCCQQFVAKWYSSPLYFRKVRLTMATTGSKLLWVAGNVRVISSEARPAFGISSSSSSACDLKYEIIIFVWKVCTRVSRPPLTNVSKVWFPSLRYGFRCGCRERSQSLRFLGNIWVYAWGVYGVMHMVKSCLTMRLAEVHVVPHGWSMEGAVTPLLVVDTPRGHKAPCCACLPPSIYSITVFVSVREKREWVNLRVLKFVF